MKTGRVEHAVRVHCSLQRAWELLTGITRLDGRGFYANSKWVEGKPWARGSRFDFDVIEPIQTHGSKVVTVYDPPYRFSLIAHGSGITSEQRFTLKEDFDGVLVTISAEYTGEPRSGKSAAEVGNVLMRHLLETLVTDCSG